MIADLLITGGQVIDGTGATAYQASVAVAGDRIVAIGSLDGVRAARTYDASGLVVCPGFVDIHTHSDLSLLSNPGALSKIRQGVTTEVIGNCGLGVTPLPSTVDIAALRTAVGYLDLDPAIDWTWPDLAGYLDVLRKARPVVNVVPLAAHIPLRAATVGFDERPATAEELERMCALLEAEFDAGAVGLSTGLVYAPAAYADDDELAALGRVVASRDGLFSWHMRDYADELLDSVAQAVRIGRLTGCRTQLSHLVAVGQRNWGSVQQALELIDEARRDGVDVAVDVYPYTAGNASLFQLIPGWAQRGGGERMLARLRDPAVRERIRAESASAPVGWDEITVNSVGGDGSGVVGRTIADLAGQRDGAEVVMDLLLEHENAVTMVAGGRSENDVLAALSHPATVIGSDGFALDPDGPTGRGMPHPRSYGCYPRLLGRYAGKIGLVEAIAKCTSRPAARVGLTDRGRIATGWLADLVVFDQEQVCDQATFQDPQRFPVGIRLVVANGEIVVDETGGA
ncbi:N-acyl-D-amino-acid deacylase family protein [Fodinicola acaciae]|uniref:N-acyl-D-amino-acid deacylase family protein n=1 Tax=Fodinicola acaciae TaxID=2681555 RepID=UPI0013D349E4|nr:D-aminoacylase [Fodinicola acaciae]